MIFDFNVLAGQLGCFNFDWAIILVESQDAGKLVN